MRPLLRRLRHDSDGLALTEFALVVPVLLVLYLAGYQLSDAIACNRKVTTATRTVADLVSQYAIMSPTQLDQILAATTQVMSPYPASNALVRVSEISTDTFGNSTVVWSRAINGTRLTQGAAFTVPPALRINGQTYIFAEVNYAYTPAANFGFVNAMGLSQTLYMVPRVSATIDCTNCPA